MGYGAVIEAVDIGGTDWSEYDCYLAKIITLMQLFYDLLLFEVRVNTHLTVAIRQKVNTIPNLAHFNYSVLRKI